MPLVLFLPLVLSCWGSQPRKRCNGKNWKIYPQNSEVQETLTTQLQIRPIIAQLLINRQIVDVESARRFLNSDLDRLHDPFLMKGMQKAVDRILLAKKNREKVFGLRRLRR
jgi:single-stranded-DNA-specific exonuclease